MEFRVLEAAVERFKEKTDYPCSEEGGCCGGRAVLVNHMTCFMATLTPLVKVAT